MTTVNSMTNVTIPETLGVSLLGMFVVFLVLVFLMVIIYIMAGVYKKASGKPAKAQADTPSAAPVTAMDDLPPASPIPAEPVLAAQTAQAVTEQSAAPAAEPMPSVPKKYRVIVNGTEYEVDAETGDSAASLSPSEPESPAVSVDAAPESPAAPAVRPPAQAATPEFSGIRKFMVVVDGKEYEVDAEMGGTANKSDTGRAQ